MNTWFPFKVSLRIVLPFSFGLLTSLRLLEMRLGALVHFLPSVKNVPKHLSSPDSTRIYPRCGVTIPYSSCATLSAMPCQDPS
ncbi:hypothetical protein EDB86DRAFT_2991309 [Lactarius hatsudake]|nr:hypothetical protein EDB86DRAFT_2991309 [Lactarius hatsudake]